MKSYEELLAKAKEWREWYYDGDPGTPEVAKSTEEAFDLINATLFGHIYQSCLLYTSPSPRDVEESRMPSSA